MEVLADLMVDLFYVISLDVTVVYVHSSLSFTLRFSAMCFLAFCGEW